MSQSEFTYWLAHAGTGLTFVGLVGLGLVIYVGPTRYFDFIRSVLLGESASSGGRWRAMLAAPSAGIALLMLGAALNYVGTMRLDDSTLTYGESLFFGGVPQQRPLRRLQSLVRVGSVVHTQNGRREFRMFKVAIDDRGSGRCFIVKMNEFESPVPDRSILRELEARTTSLGAETIGSPHAVASALAAVGSYRDPCLLWDRERAEQEFGDVRRLGVIRYLEESAERVAAQETEGSLGAYSPHVTLAFSLLEKHWYYAHHTVMRAPALDADVRGLDGRVLSAAGRWISVHFALAILGILFTLHLIFRGVGKARKWLGSGVEEFLLRPIPRSLSQEVRPFRVGVILFIHAAGWWVTATVWSESDSLLIRRTLGLAASISVESDLGVEEDSAEPLRRPAAPPASLPTAPDSLRQQERDEILALLAMAIVERRWQTDSSEGRIGHNIGAVLIEDDSDTPYAFALNENAAHSSALEHAELRTIRRAYARHRSESRPEPYQSALHDFTMYTTLEPCSMCAGTLDLSNVSRVVYVQADPTQGGIAAHLRALHGSEASRPVRSGVALAHELDDAYGALPPGSSITGFLRSESAHAVFKDAVRALRQYSAAYRSNRALLRNCRRFLRSANVHPDGTSE